jgi:protein-disulfide isomerase
MALRSIFGRTGEVPLTEQKKVRGLPVALGLGAILVLGVAGAAPWTRGPTKTQALASAATAVAPTPAPEAAPNAIPDTPAAAPDAQTQTSGANATSKPVSAKKSPSKSTKAAEPLTTPLKAVGSKNAPIVMEVFSDYQCPACRNLFEQTLRPLMNDYVAAGKVYLVHRDFPLPMHPHGYQAARWVNAAAEAGKFEDIEGALYENQVAWSADGDMEKFVSGALSRPDFERVKKFMTGCSEDVPPLFKLQASGEAQTGGACPLDTFIEADKALGNKVPVTQTPTYVITNKGTRLAPGAGYVSYPILKQFFDSLPN